MLRRVSAVVVAGALVAPAPAAGATVRVDRPCVGVGERATFTGRDLTPNAAAELALTAQGASAPFRRSTRTADAQGLARFPIQFSRSTALFDGSTTKIRVTAQVGMARTAFTFARRDVAVRGGLAPDRAAAIRATGFASQRGRALYAHWTRAGVRKTSLRLGRLGGACGDLTRRLDRGFPFRPVAPGTWHVAFNTSRSNPRAAGTVVVRAARVKRRVP